LKNEKFDLLKTICVLIERMSFYDKNSEAKKDLDELYQDVIEKCK
jgi:hypothetical protein